MLQGVQQHDADIETGHFVHRSHLVLQVSHSVNLSGIFV